MIEIDNSRIARDNEITLENQTLKANNNDDNSNNNNNNNNNIFFFLIKTKLYS